MKTKVNYFFTPSVFFDKKATKFRIPYKVNELSII